MQIQLNLISDINEFIQGCQYYTGEIEITQGRQGTEKMQRKHTRGHWSNRQRAEPMERYAV